MLTVVCGAPCSGKSTYVREHQMVHLDVGRAELHRRADAAGRPARWHQLIDEHLARQVQTTRRARAGSGSC